jgi:hypothetical protein
MRHRRHFRAPPWHQRPVTMTTTAQPATPEDINAAVGEAVSVLLAVGMDLARVAIRRHELGDAYLAEIEDGARLTLEITLAPLPAVRCVVGENAELLNLTPAAPSQPDRQN